MSEIKKERHRRFEAAEALLGGTKSLEELMTSRELMLEHLHMFEGNPDLPKESPIIVGFQLLIAAIEARIRFKEFLITQQS
jgi:hypothetical protein